MIFSGIIYTWAFLDEAFEDAMNTENVSDEGLFSPTLSDQENNNAKQKLRRRQVKRMTYLKSHFDVRVARSLHF